MRRQLVLFTIAIVTVSAISAQDSRGNWSNEKETPVYSYIYEIKDDRGNERVQDDAGSEETSYEERDKDNESSSVTADYSNDAEQTESTTEDVTVEIVEPAENINKSEEKPLPNRRPTIRFIQPYVVNLEPDESLTGADQSQFDNKESSTELQRPPRTNRKSSKLSTTDPDADSLRFSVTENVIALENSGNFGARVTPVSSIKDTYRTPVRNKVIVVSENLYRASQASRKSPPNSVKNQIDEKERPVYESSTNTVKSTKLKAVSRLQSGQEDLSPAADSDSKKTEVVSTSIASDISTSSTTSSSPQSSVRFSKPIVVPDFPRQKKYLYTPAPDYPENNVVPSSPSPSLMPPRAPPFEGIKKVKASELSYLQQSSMVLSPLQAGLALINAGELTNVTNASEELPEVDTESPGSQKPVANPEDIAAIPSDDYNEDPSGLTDQILEPQEISDAVTQKTPTQPVEIQKSIEIYHTAPVQEIHYPVEFVPHFQKSPGNSLGRDRRPQTGFSSYKSNEIPDDRIVPPSATRLSLDGNRYEYNTETEFKKLTPLKTNFAVEVQPSQVEHEEYNVQYAPSESQVNTRLPGESQEPEELSKPTKEQLFEFQRILPQGINPGILGQEQIQATKLSPLGISSSKDINGENFEGQIRKVPQYLVPVGKTYPVEKVIEKTVHVPHPISIEKVVEKKVPFPVEKIIEKQVMIAHPYPIHIQVPVDRVIEKQIRIPHIYPIHIEKVIEKKIPYTVQRLIVQPYPVHVQQQIQGNYPVEKFLEKPGHLPRYQLEIPKYVKTLPGSHFPPNLQSHPNRNPEKNYYQSLPNNRPVLDENQANASEFVDQNYRQPGNQPLSRKYTSYGNYYSSIPSYQALVINPQYRRRGVYVVNDKEKSKAEYMNLQLANSFGGLPSKSLQYSSIDVQNPSGVPSGVSSRRARQEILPSNTGTFRQSKMEYGFKPPMVPSVQYDEKTASKVEK